MGNGIRVLPPVGKWPEREDYLFRRSTVAPSPEGRAGTDNPSLDRSFEPNVLRLLSSPCGFYPKQNPRLLWNTW
jgi:hypothetical protein